MSKELEDEAEQIIDEYANKRAKEAIMRAEKLKNSTWTPPYETIVIALRVANQWIDYLAPNLGPDFHYKYRTVGNTYQIYQDADKGKKERPPDPPEIEGPDSPIGTI